MVDLVSRKLSRWKKAMLCDSSDCFVPCSVCMKILLTILLTIADLGVALPLQVLSGCSDGNAGL